MVGLGQDTLLLCKVWCDPVEAARAGCHQEDARTSPGVTGRDNCGPEALSRAVLAGDSVQQRHGPTRARAMRLSFTVDRLCVSLTGWASGF